jgi:hypothetical protein
VRVVIVLSPLERLIDAIDRLHGEGKTVEKVAVTQGEMEALLNCPIGPDVDDPQGKRSCFKDGELYVRQVRVLVAPIERGDVVGEDVTVNGSKALA